MSTSASSDPEARARAVEQATSLLALLRARPNQGSVAKPVYEAEQLLTAIQSFHMEAIRFRMYSIDRFLSTPGSGATAEEIAVLQDLHASLEAAGFHTRSAPHHTA
jgi:hypothetical protein